jgi:hypothetical protein
MSAAQVQAVVSAVRQLGEQGRALVSVDVTHGLSLSPVDRKAAAVRIMTCYPLWSDRRDVRERLRRGESPMTATQLQAHRIHDSDPKSAAFIASQAISAG